jgi:hypothetical protein
VLHLLEFGSSTKSEGKRCLIFDWSALYVVGADVIGHTVGNVLGVQGDFDIETCARLLAHVNEPDSHMGRFLLCPVSVCPLAVSQTPLPKRRYLHHFRKHQNRGEITGDEIVQEIKPEQASRCDLYDVIIQDAYIDMNWTENLNDKVIGARDYSLKETADVPSLQSRHVQGTVRRIPKIALKTIWTMN